FCRQVLVHTGQNHDPNLSDVFFRELGVRQPDVHLGITAEGFAEQAGQVLTRAGEVLERECPDRLLILGDTNSGLAAIVAARLGIPVFHMEAGNRCFDDRVPEEINRRIIDHSSAVLMPYTHRSKENLLRDGIERQRIYVIGNPIFEVLHAYAAQIEASDALRRLQVAKGEFFLVTLHRAENVDQSPRLEKLCRGLALVADTYKQPMVVSLHPRTADKLARFGLKPGSERVRLLPPMGFFDFVHLERSALCVLTDSGTVQEECCISRVPNLTLRDVTERAETIEVGSNLLTGSEPEAVLEAVRVALETNRAWSPPPEYLEAGVSSTVARIVLGFLFQNSGQ
ncbi:MAG: non-hydrolyzing UDP-N-acetylglucosamine 2-epimerase, partial [Terriglobales bacterium]